MGREGSNKRTDRRTDGRAETAARGVQWSSAFNRQNARQVTDPSQRVHTYVSMAIAPMGQLVFEYSARDEARRRSALLLRIADVELQLSNEKSKINRPRGLPLSALISHACSTERGIVGAARALLIPAISPNPV